MSSTPNISTPSAPSGGAPVSQSGALIQLNELPKDELDHLAEDLGIDPTAARSREHLVAAIHERRQMIAAMDREAMLEVVRWGRRAVPANAAKEQLALEIARIKSMRFTGLSQQALIVLAVMRGVDIKGDEDADRLTRRLKRQEGFFHKLARKRRAWIGSIVSGMLATGEEEAEYKHLPPEQDGGAGGQLSAAARESSMKDEIEEQGLLTGLASKVKRTADSYLNQKLDEIEARIDRKLDEIDRRMSEWRDKEVANRLRILKITLWASLVVSAVSLIYMYVKVYLLPHR